MSNLISLVVLTKNEEKNLIGLFNNIKDLPLTIHIIDSHSTDKTIEISKKFGAEIHKKEFDNFASQRNYAIKKMNTKWIMFVDADERLSKDLKDFIINFDETYSEKNISAFKFKRKTKAFGKELNFTWNDKVTRLINKEKCVYDKEKLVHEKLKVNGNIKLVNKGYFLHITYKDFIQYLKKMNLYIELEGQSLSKMKISLTKILFISILTFLDRLFIKKWILDGVPGIYAATTAFIVKFLSYSLGKSLSEDGNLFKRDD